MKKIITLLLLSLTLFAKNPSVYSQLGDTIYNNYAAVEKLAEIEEFSEYGKEIQEYIKDVNATKKDGFAIESGDRSVDDALYLKKLRELYKKDRKFLRIAKISFEESMKNDNIRLFEQLINSGTIKLDEYKESIVKFYTRHKEEISLSQEPKLFIQENQQKRKSAIKSDAAKKRESEAERIRWFREKDREKQERKRKLLEEELLKQKKEIREYQKEELLGS